MPPSRRPDVSSVASPPRRSLTYDDLRIIERLGGGGHATVYKARVKGHDVPEYVAVKEPANEERTLPASAAKEFIREAETWEQLDSRERTKQLWTEYEHLVGIVDTGDELPWIAMEFMDGGTLAERIKGERDIEIPQLRWIADCICRGVELAHYEGISHLDLKPKNVLFRKTKSGTWDVAKIADWGTSSRPLEANDDSGLSVPFGAPEQFDPEQFGEPDSMTDVYQVGAILYAAAVGEPPYSGSRIEISQAVAKGPTPPSEERRDLPAEFDKVIERAMAPDKQDRYRTIRDLAAAIADVPDPRSTADGGSATTRNTAADSPTGSGATPVGSAGEPAGPTGPSGPSGPSGPDGSVEAASAGMGTDAEVVRDDSPIPDPLGTVGLPPCNPPIEVIEGDNRYFVREFKRNPSEAAVFSTHDRRMTAMRAASNMLTEEHHPCTLRWDTHNSVGEIYWNEHFEELRVEYSPFLEAWLVVPRADQFAFASAPNVKRAYKYGKRIQQEYDFQELKVCSPRGKVEKVVEHRFIRHSLTKSGVKFNRED
ncbi:serine/threonine protein kinase [Halonotius terrestris]|uniref:Serine/threonine protein kinase n=1 Tax=Halonotius terrestris TaxID=2487750 RepID=A0A8J8TCA5_9EURY|nr:serine/threonine-protein kinase [Halonotius terrestris]TQQ79924.1 serine/threonine protein kinase [Halonotius terrestris]